MLKCVNESEDSFLAIVSLPESRQTMQSAEQSDLDVVDKLHRVRENARQVRDGRSGC